MTGMPPNRRWSPQEDDWLAANYDDLGAAACARQLGRAKKGVYSRAQKLGLTSPERNAANSRFTEQREAELRAAYAKGPLPGTIKRLAARWDVSYTTVQRWARNLGLTRSYGTATPTQRWSDEEDQILEATAHLSAEATVARLARRGYRRTVNAVLHRRWTQRVSADDAGYYSVNQVAEFLGLHYNTVSGAIERGEMKAVRREGEQRTAVIYVHRRQVRKWLKADPARINRHQVDMTWLVDLLTNGG
jgi:excisionase family DNA binding protein